MSVDLSKLDPKFLMELSQLVRDLPPDQLNRMQSIMHNAAAGFDVRQQTEEFERSLPAGFREKLMGLLARYPGATQLFASQMGFGGAAPAATSTSTPATANVDVKMDVYEARIEILRGVAAGKISPEEAEKLLF